MLSKIKKILLGLNNKQKLYVVFAIVVLTLVLVSPGLFSNSPLYIQKSRELYKQAKELQENGEYKEAYSTYSKIPSAYIANSIVLYQQSKCAAALQDEKTAILKLENLVSKHKNTTIEPLANYNLGQAYIRTGNYNKAKKIFVKITKKYPQSNFAKGSLYYLGQVNKASNKNTALKYWFEYLAISPDGRFAMDCVDEIRSLKLNLTSSQKKSVGIALFSAKKYREALTYFRQVPIKDSWYYLAKINFSLGNNNQGQYFLKEGIWKYSKNAGEEEMQDAASIYVRKSKQSELRSWSDLALASQNARDFILFNKAKFIPTSDAIQLYKVIATNYPQGKYSSESLWNLFWYEFGRGNYNQAINLGKTHYKKFANTKASPKILFWTAKAYERIGQKSLAKDYYNEVLSLYPDSYYAFRSNGRLKGLNYGNDPGWTTRTNSSIRKQAAEVSLQHHYSDLKRTYSADIVELINTGDYETVLSVISDDPFLESWINLENGLISKSIVLARDGMNELVPKPDLQDKRWKFIYPLFYADEINYYAHINNTDPFLILALMKEESYFNPLAVSSSNARGLMQILPGTAGDIARWNNFNLTSTFQLFDPKTNIKFGTAYFRQIRERLGNSSVYAVAGYNGGPGAVEKWLRTFPYQDVDQFIENIPYDQTREYVRKVYGSYWNYRRIYN